MSLYPNFFKLVTFEMLCPPIPNVLLKDLTYKLFYFSQNDKWQYVMA